MSASPVLMSVVEPQNGLKTSSRIAELNPAPSLHGDHQITPRARWPVIDRIGKKSGPRSKPICGNARTLQASRTIG
jgi:hypothetical protein